MSSTGTHQLSISINGRHESFDVEPRSTLAELLREQAGLTGTKIGCEQGSCGACTILFDGKQVRSCLMFAVQAADSEVWTIEGLASPPPENQTSPNPLAALPELAEAFKRNHALQCGFCTPGMLIAGTLIGEACGGAVNEERVKEGLSGNICRCTGYQGIVQSVVEVFRLKTSNSAVEKPQ